MQIIGFAGKSGSGKTTAAGIMAGLLCEQGKRVMVDSFFYPAMHSVVEEFGYIDKDSVEQRIRKQKIATDLREDNPKWFVECMIRRNRMWLQEQVVPFEELADFLIISDVRMPNEYEFCRRYGVVIYMQGIYRPLFGLPAEHETEMRVEDLLHDADDVIPKQQDDSLSSFINVLREFIKDGRHLKRFESKPVA